MDKSPRIETIDPATFDDLLLAYPDVVPGKLSELDKQRYDIIPDSIEKQNGSPSLTKEQVATLVDWKLSHGKFRPTLKSLLQQNAGKDVENTTRDGFKAFSGSGESAKAGLNILTKLKGIGPATASLLLSVFNPDTAPFFSDELFRWCFYEAGRGKGWDREIKYNVKEYLQLFDKIQEFKQRFRAEHQREIAAVEIEKVAYVLGKQHAGSSADQRVVGESQSSKRKATSEDASRDGPGKAARLNPSVKAGKKSPGQPANNSQRSKRAGKPR